MNPALLVLFVTIALPQRPNDDRLVEPSALARDPKLIGREVVVDDRVRYFQPGPRGARGPSSLDELLLKRTEVVFRLPPNLRPEHPPREPAARVTGILRSDARGLYCEVTGLEMKPADLDRLEQEVRRLDPADGAGRSAWAAWADRRARDFDDTKLAARARTLEAEAIRLDADRPGADDLALARRARSRGLGDTANALNLRGLRSRLESARTADDLAKVAAEVEAVLPRSKTPGRVAGVGEIRARLRSNPIGVYASATEAERAGLERDLLGDALQLGIERRAAASPGDALALAEEARDRLPDRPEVAGRLRDAGLGATERRATSMRLSEVEALARTFREAGQADRARTLLKTWLDDQRAHLNPSDSEGHVLLAGQYVSLLNDRSTAAELLRDALRAEADLKSAIDAYRRLGFRKSAETGDWYDPTVTPQTAPAAEVAPASAPTARRGQGDSLRGMSVDQARRLLGSRPDRITRESTQEATLEHWIYQGPPKTRVIVIRRPLGRARAEVIGDYTLP